MPLSTSALPFRIEISELFRIGLDRGYFLLDILGRACGAVRQFPYFVGDHGEAAALIAGAEASIAAFNASRFV